MNKWCVLFLSMVIGSGAFGQNSFSKDFGNYSMHPLTSGYNINAFNTVENTKGRRYFFDEWVRGSVVNSAGKEIASEDYYFNLDKVNNDLLVTKDKKEIIQIKKESVKEIHFTDKIGMAFEFTRVEKISPYRFVEVIVKTAKYNVYKSINTRLVKSNYTTNGITESGNPYDEYVDAPEYFIMYKDELRPVQLKFRSMKSKLKEESKMVNQFYADHLEDEVDENYLKNLIIYISQPAAK